MELLQLKYFCDAAKTQNFSKTAKKFGVPASNISQTIKRLESELETELFVHMSNKISLNEQGMSFYSDVSKILENLEQAKIKIKDMDSSVCCEIKILVLANRRVVTKAIEQFTAMYPDVSFALSHMRGEDIDKYDIVISSERMPETQYTNTGLIREQMALAVNTGHPLANADTIDIKNLQGEKFITMQTHSNLYEVTQAICRKAGFVPNIAIQSDDPYYIRKYIELGLGIAIVPPVSWKGQFSDKIVLKNIDGMQRTTYLSLRSDRYIARGVRLFAQLLSDISNEY